MPDASFRSINFPDRFIRHFDFLGELTPVVSDQDRSDATFTIVWGRADRRLISFQSINFPDRFLRHQDFRLRLDVEPSPPSDLFSEDATFIMMPGLADVTAVSFSSFNFPDHVIRHREFHLFIEPLGSANLVHDATFKIERPLFFDPHLH